MCRRSRKYPYTRRRRCDLLWLRKNDQDPKSPKSKEGDSFEEALDDHTTETDKPTVSVIKTGILEKHMVPLEVGCAGRYYVLTEDALCRFHRKADDDFFGKQIAKYILTDVENVVLKQDDKCIIHVDVAKHGQRVLRAKTIAEATKKWRGQSQRQSTGPKWKQKTQEIHIL